MAISDNWVTPNCPMCGQPPLIAFEAQAFCGNEECKVMHWTPTKTVEENLADVADIQLPDSLGREGG